MNRDEIKNSVIEWNIRFPIDRWWRKKYNIAFDSSEHRESSFLNQLFEYEEDCIFNEIDHKKEYVPNTSDWLKPQDDRDQLESLIDEFSDLKDDGTYGG